jgi:hypothetical protein
LLTKELNPVVIRVFSLIEQFVGVLAPFGSGITLSGVEAFAGAVLLESV